ncbi:MAG: GMC family oxidoreductase N-terminal domain-containing protein [Microthrixaceae bacterium]
MLVVGAGSAGATLAARLARLGVGSVALVDAGPDTSTGGGPAWLSDPDRLGAADDPLVARTPLRSGDPDPTGAAPVGELLSGRLVGGSSAVNSAYFVRATDSDLVRWSHVGPSWAPAGWLEAYRAVESDRDMVGPRHGSDGAVPVSRRSRPTHPVTAALFAAAEGSGIAAHPDLNDGGELGWGLLPRNVDGRRRVGSGAMLADPLPDGLSVHGGVDVERIVFQGSRVVGVDASVDGRSERLDASTVVISAGAVGSADLLWSSGIGPAEALRAAGRHVVQDAPGMGRRVSNHAAIELMWRPLRKLDQGPLLQGVVHFAVGDGQPVEVLATCRPYGVATGEHPGDSVLSLRVSPMRPRSVGSISWSGDLAVVEGRYLADPVDRTVLRSAVRQVTAWAHGEAFGDLLGEWSGPGPVTLTSDEELDSWVAAHLGTSMHLCSTAPAGQSDDPSAVVDEWGRVRGVEGLHVVDCSILPDVPSRGPAFTAMALGELLAPAVAATALAAA